MLAALLATALAAAPQPALAYDPFEDPAPEAGARSRLALMGWGGEYVGAPGSRRSSGSLVGAEATWSFDTLDLGLQGSYAQLQDHRSTMTPMVLVRLGQRFETRRGIEATFNLGLGSARTTHWQAWFQVAIGARLELGPMFLATELAFEQADLIRLAAGLGVKF